MTDIDPIVRDLAELITEWRKTCAQMGIRYTDQQAAQFVIDSGLIDTHDAAVVAAVTPLIRAQIADEIEAQAKWPHWGNPDSYTEGLRDGISRGANIARGDAQ